MPIHDVSYDIPDYKEFSDDDLPPEPDEEIPADERERLFEELCRFIDAGKYDPKREYKNPD